MQKFYTFHLLWLSVTVFLLADVAIAQDARGDSNNAGQGKQVDLIHGSGFSSLQVAVVKQTIENKGCPVSTPQVLGDGDQMIVNVEGRMVIVTDDMGEATAEAIEHCVSGEPG